jgi:hypothetical protein
MLYAIDSIRLFSNGDTGMFEIRGHCHADGQFVRYFQEEHFFACRVALYLQAHPGVDSRQAVFEVASAALDQYRRSWVERAELPRE